MKQTILALLIAKFSGVRKDVLEVLAGVLALQATNEDEAKGIVEKLTDAQVTDFGKDYRSGVDKEVNESNKTFESNLRKKYDFKEKETEPGGNHSDKTDPNDVAKNPHEITHGPDALRYFAQTYVLAAEPEQPEEEADDEETEEDYFHHMCGTGLSRSYIFC